MGETSVTGLASLPDDGLRVKHCLQVIDSTLVCLGACEDDAKGAIRFSLDAMTTLETSQYCDVLVPTWCLPYGCTSTSTS